jgi:hypothetical protein
LFHQRGGKNDCPAARANPTANGKRVRGLGFGGVRHGAALRWGANAISCLQPGMWLAGFLDTELRMQQIRSFAGLRIWGEHPMYRW